jgi:hypothetical protein
MTLQERREKMIKLVHDWQHSDKSQKVFAEAHGIKLFTFRYWIQKQREQENTTGAFMQLGGQATTCFNIRYPNGTELQLPATTTLSTLKVLLSL